MSAPATSSRFPRLLLVAALATVSASARADDGPPEFTVQLDVVKQELDPGFCWFHPRAAAIPMYGGGRNPLVLLTLQKHLVADDHYSGLYVMKSDDLGKTWTGPTLPPELDWQQTGDGETIAVCDATPGWHHHTRRLLVIGTRLRYSQAGAQLLDKPRSYDFAYAVYDPSNDLWTTWRTLDMPRGDDGQFHQIAPGCVQWLVRPDGAVLVPIYYQGLNGGPYSVTVVQCSFDGKTLRYVKHGDELRLNEVRGLSEPSLTWHAGRYFLTLRNDDRGYVTVSNDGLKFAPIRPWTFDDGKDLGSFNTQQHWVAHSDGLFLAYTRRGADNDHITRNRAPLFLARVDPDTLHVIRATEKELMPERGVMLGNFGAAAVAPNETWVTDSEFITGGKAHPRGANGSTFLARVKWSRPNRLATINGRRDDTLRIVALGDSITKGVRPGVTAEQTFSALLEKTLKAKDVPFEVVNVGIGGERTDGALARLNRDVIAKSPQIVLVMYGTNDSYVDKDRNESRISVEEYRRNLVTIIERLKAEGIAAVLMTEPRWGDAAGKNGVGEHPNLRLEKYVEACRDVAKELKVPLIDHYRRWTTAREKGIDIGTWTTDQCHPNPTGHQMIAEPIADWLLPFFMMGPVRKGGTPFTLRRGAKGSGPSVGDLYRNRKRIGPAASAAGTTSKLYGAGSKPAIGSGGQDSPAEAEIPPFRP